MSPTFTPLQALFIVYFGFWQFLVVPALAICLLISVYFSRRRIQIPTVIIFVFLVPLIALQVRSLLAILPVILSPQQIAWATKPSIASAGFWLLIFSIIAAALVLVKRTSNRPEPSFNKIARMVAMLAIGMTVITATYMNQLQAEQKRLSTVPGMTNEPKPQYFAPGRAIRGATLESAKLTDTGTVVFLYRDQYDQVVYVQETPNSPYTNETLGCSAQDIETKYCVLIGHTATGGPITGHPSSEYVGVPGKGRWVDGYGSVKALVGTTLIEIGRETSDHTMTEDFNSYFGTYVRVGRSHLPLTN